MQVLKRIAFLIVLGSLISQCTSPSSNTENDTENSEQNNSNPIKEALTFYASFDNGYDADFAKGDPKIYTALAYDSLSSEKAGMENQAVVLNDSSGLTGSSIQFKEKTRPVIYYQSLKNITYDTANWSGTISLWLSLNPEEDLAPGYTDPIQITDSGYDDAAFWVDFTNKNPRSFRMGVYGDVAVWNPDNIGPDENPGFQNRLVPAKDRPFSRDQWTHVVVTFDGLNSEKGIAKFYINGIPQGSKSISEPFTWEYEKSKMFLGLSYIGLLDDLSIYNRALEAIEVEALYSMKKGVHELLSD